MLSLEKIILNGVALKYSMVKNITWENYSVNRDFRENQQQHKSCVLWFTGLSGSGKSTIANAVEKRLAELNVRSYILDGDNVRHGLNNDLNFTDNDRRENIRRISEVSKLFCDSGTVILAAFISPFIVDRNQARKLLSEDFIEIYIDTPLDVCENRDPKGLYKKARAGGIKNFTGIDSKFEPPLTPEIHIKTAENNLSNCTQQIINFMISKKIIKEHLTLTKA